MKIVIKLLLVLFVKILIADGLDSSFKFATLNFYDNLQRRYAMKLCKKLNI